MSNANLNEKEIKESQTEVAEGENSEQSTDNTTENGPESSQTSAEQEEGQEPETVEESETDEGSESENKDNSPPWVVKKFAKLKKRIHRAEEIAFALHEENIRLKSAQPQQPQEEPQPVVNLPKPKREQFEDETDYILAVNNYAAELKRAKEVNVSIRNHEDAMVNSFVTKAQKLKKEHDDFEETGAKFVGMSTRAMQDAVLNSELGPTLVYHLGKNPDETKRIASMHPVAAIKEIGRLEEKLLSSKPKIKTSTAPRALGDPKSNSTLTAPDPKNLDAWGEMAMNMSASEFCKRWDGARPKK